MNFYHIQLSIQGGIYMEIEMIIQQLVSSIRYYEKLPCIKVNGSDLFETNNKYIHKDSRRLNELNIINPLKKIMTDSNLTDKLDYSSLGVTISKSVNQFEISAVSKKYILFISKYIRNKKNLTDYISIVAFIQEFIQKNYMPENELYVFSYCINKYFYTSLHLFVHNKMKTLYLESKFATDKLYQCLIEDEDINIENEQLNDFAKKYIVTYSVINDYLNNLRHNYTKALCNAIADFFRLYVNIDKIDSKTQDALNKILDILENCDDFFKIHAHLKDINENTNIIVDNLKHYTEDKDKKTVKRTENIIARFKNADSLLICNKEKISALFFNKYLASLIYDNYSKFYSIFKMNDFCTSNAFNELAEYIWNNPLDADDIYKRIQNKLKDQNFICNDFTKKAFDISAFDEEDFAVCKLVSNISFIYACVDENVIYNILENTIKDEKN